MHFPKAKLGDFSLVFPNMQMRAAQKDFQNTIFDLGVQ